MAFYTEFSEYYETVFPFRQPVLDFLNRWLPAQGRILDIGCGTGAYCGRLANKGRRCLGIDLDPHMIQVAESTQPQAEFNILDMETIDILPEKQFSGIYCIGNVLPHLPTGRLLDFLVDLKGLLAPGGVWIFQTVNFDPLIGLKEFIFPVRDFPSQELQFHRKYTDLGHGKFLFQTRLVHQGREIFNGEVTLYPRDSKHCLKIHREAGFELVRHFADFTEKPFISRAESGSVYVFSAPEG